MRVYRKAPKMQMRFTLQALDAGRRRAGARSTRPASASGSRRRRASASTPTTRPCRTCWRPRATARSWTSAGATARARRSGPSGRSRRSASSPTRGRTSSCATCASRTAATSRVVFNRGREAAGPFDVDFLRDGVAVGTRRGHRARAADADRRDPARRRGAARPGRRSRRSPTRAREVDEADEENDSLSASAELGPCTPAYTGRAMKTEIHPEYHEATRALHLRERVRDPFHQGRHHVEICSNCHPFYTGKQKLVDTAAASSASSASSARESAQLPPLPSRRASSAAPARSGQPMPSMWQPAVRDARSADRRQRSVRGQQPRTQTR